MSSNWIKFVVSVILICGPSITLASTQATTDVQTETTIAHVNQNPAGKPKIDKILQCDCANLCK